MRLREYKKLKDRVFLVEAIHGGLEFRLLSQRLECGDRAFWLPVNMNENQVRRSREHALIECSKGVPYDYGSLFRNAFGRVNADARKYFCSEYIWLNWVYANMADNEGLIAPRPADLPGLVKSDPLEIEI